MNVKMVVTVALVCGATMLGGCAGMHSKGDPSALSPATDNQNNLAGNVAYVAAVNRQAERMGVTVVWVNPPDKQSRN